MSHHRRPESVLVVVYTDSGDVLLLKRAQPFEFWQSVTGSLLPVETHAAAAGRELAEETGLRDEGAMTYTGISRQFVIDPRWRNRFGPGVVENVEYEYRYRTADRVTIQMSSQEHSYNVWLPVSEAIDRVWSWTNKAALQQLQVTL